MISIKIVFNAIERTFHSYIYIRYGKWKKRSNVTATKQIQNMQTETMKKSGFQSQCIRNEIIHCMLSTPSNERSTDQKGIQMAKHWKQNHSKLF